MIIVVGASSGIGEALARRLVAHGYKVAAVARRADRLEALAKACGPDLLPFVHDVTDVDSVPSLFVEITRQLGGLDAIVYASGVMPSVEIDEYSTAKDKAMIDVNVLGAVAWLNAAAARFEGTGSGTIVGIGSVAGDRGRRGQPVYNASKAFLHTYLEALRNRLSAKGVRVVTIKPGPVRTEMTAHLTLKKALTADQAAERIHRAMTKSGEVYLEPAHRVIFTIIRHIPSWIFRRLKF